MNFIWDIALKAMECGVAEKELQFLQAAEFSPYFEQSCPVLNETKVEPGIIEINSFFRFAKLFQELLRPEYAEFPDFKKQVFDCAVHVLLFCDLRHGLSRRELYIRKLAEDIRAGILGKRLCRAYGLIDRKKRNRIAAILLNQITSGSSLVLFRKAVVILYPDAMLYQIKAERQKLLLYVECTRQADQEECLWFLTAIFLPVNYRIRTFWGVHFGVLGVNGTMKLSEMEIY